MNFGIKGKKALIVGGSQGVGLETAKLLEKEGVQCLLIGRDKKNLKKALLQLKNKHYIIASNLMESNISKICKKIYKTFGSPDIIVHCIGGTMNTRSALSEISLWKKVMKYNLEIPIEINNYFVPYMKENKWGRIIHLSSISTIRGWATPLYVTAKTALNSYSRGLGLELAESGIVVTSILSGVFASNESGFKNWKENNPKEFNEYISRKTMIKREATFKEIASQIVFNSSIYCTYSTGSFTTIDGGTI